MIANVLLTHAADNRIFCSDYRKRENHTFYPSRHCQRSNGTQIGAINVVSLDKCADFARSVKALAFNYGRFNTSDGRRAPKNLFEVVAEKKRRKGLGIKFLIGYFLVDKWSNVRLQKVILQFTMKSPKRILKY